MKYDYKTLYEQHAAFYQARPKAKKALLLINKWLPYFFIVFYCAAFLWLALKTKSSFMEQIGFLALPMLALFIVSILRLAVNRARPFVEGGAGITPLVYKKESLYNSFPSRHATSATVIATVCLPFFPFVGTLLFLLALGVLYTRFATGLHYPSDLLTGGGIGLLIGLCIFFF